MIVERRKNLGVLIYRESQLRKAEAAAARVKRPCRSKKTHLYLLHHQGKSSLPSQQRKGASKRRKQEPSLEEDRPKKKDGKKEVQI